MNKYLKVSITLGSIAAGAALIIGLANFVTANRIEANKLSKEKAALKEIYNVDNTDIYQELTKDDGVDYSSFNYISKIYKDTSVSTTFIYVTSGKNSYGAISMLVGVSKDGPSNIVLTEDTETYKDTLEESYVANYNKSEEKLVAYADVTCGATYGAKLIKAMIDEAIIDYNGRVL